MRMEIWKTVPHTNKKYQVSTLGRVRRRTMSGDWQILNQYDQNGYRTVYVEKVERKKVLVHRLVADCFCENPEEKPCVNHIDGVKNNNDCENLEWCTDEENRRHAIRTGLAPDIRSFSYDNSRKTLIKNVITKAEYNFDSQKDAAAWIEAPISQIRKAADTGELVAGEWYVQSESRN